MSKSIHSTNRQYFNPSDCECLTYCVGTTGNKSSQIVSVANQDGKFESGHLLYWTEDSRIHTIADQQYYSYYTYGHGGERTLKLVGQNSVLDVNANTTNNARMLDDATLYPPPLYRPYIERLYQALLYGR